MSTPIEPTIIRDVEAAAAKDPAAAWRLAAIAAIYAGLLLAYLLVASVNGHNAAATADLRAIGAVLAPLVTFGLGVLVPSPFSRT